MFCGWKFDGVYVAVADLICMRHETSLSISL